MILTSFTEARLFLPLFAFVAGAELLRKKWRNAPSMSGIGSGTWSALFEQRPQNQRLRNALFFMAGVVGFLSWSVLFASALYPFHSMEEVNQQVDRIVDNVRNYRAQHGALPEGLEQASPDPALYRDPWGRNYYYRKGQADFQIGSVGPDGKPGTRDDFNYKFR